MMNAFANHFAFEFKTTLRNPTQLLMNYLFPLAFYAMMGLVMVQINPGFNDIIIPSLVVFAIMVGTVLGLSSPLVESRDAGIFRSFKINGVPALSILSIPTLSTIFHTLIVSAIIALTGGPFFGGATPGNWGAFALVTLVTAFCLGSLGALIGVVASGSRSTVLLSQGVFLPSMLLGGLMMPLSVLPESVHFVSGLLPTTYAMQAFEGLAYARQTVFDPLLSLGILVASGLVSALLALYLFNWDSRNQSRRGHPLMGLLAFLPFIVGILLAR
jgi:ABC-2 type transport system permease protein